VPSKS
jgi:hypothetical protein